MLRILYSPEEDKLKTALFERIKSDLGAVRAAGGFAAAGVVSNEGNAAGVAGNEGKAAGLADNEGKAAGSAAYGNSAGAATYGKSAKDGAVQATANQVILVVPAQFTLEAERAAFEALGAPGFFDFHVMSGNKLRQEILRETGGPGVTPINGIGRAMLLRRIAAEKGGSLTAFGKVCKRPEFLDLAADFIVQLKQNRFRPEDLEGIRGELKPDSLLFAKLSDMQQLCSAYEQAMTGRFTDSEGMLRFTAEKVAESSLIRRSIIWYYDFYSFTPNEIAFLGQLMQYSAGLGVALLHADGTGNATAAGNFTGAVNADDDRFAVTSRTVQHLKEEAQRRNMQVSCDAIPAAENKPGPETHVVRCSTPHTQAQTIASRVLELIRTGAAKADEIAILTGDMEGCGSEIRRVFTQLEIPLFMDEKRSVQHNPAIALVSYLLDMTADGMRRDSVIGFLKTGLTGIRLPSGYALSTKKTDDFENYCKQYHISRERFIKPLKYGKKGLGEGHFNALEEMRAAIAAVLAPFVQQMAKAGTVREKTEVLCRFLMGSLHLPKTLESRALVLDEAGLADASGEISQMWQVITSVMDQAVELIGDVEMDAAEFRKLYQDAFADIKVGLLPQQEGRVTLGTIKRSKLSNIKALFVAGTNEGQIPSDHGSENLLTEDELELLAEKGYILSKSSTILAEEEMLNIYKAFSAPADYFWIGYCMEDGSAAAVRPSPLVLDMIAKGAPVEKDVENNDNPEDFLTGRLAATEELGRNLRSLASGETEDLPDIWKRTYNILREDDDPMLDTIRQGLLFTNSEKPLKEKTVRELYSSDGDFLYSASALEKYADCAFKHFVAHGLRPDEPRELEIAGSEIGNIYHECLMTLSAQLTKECEEKGIAITAPESPWMTISKDDLRTLVGRILDCIAEEKLEGLMKEGPAEVYRSSRIREIALRFAWQMVQQLRCGNIDRMKVETPFGYDNTPSVTIDTSAGKVKIIGRIDRMDISGNLLKIIDYKSGNNTFDRKEVEEGYALQLMVYLESALEGEKGSEPAGMFYYRIGDQSGSCSLEDISAEIITDDILARIEKNYMLDGLYVADDRVISVIDTAAVSTGESGVINYKTKDGVPKGSGVSKEEFEQLRVTFRGAVERIVRSLNSGEIAPHPHRTRNHTACSYCDYRGICIFDTGFAANSYK